MIYGIWHQAPADPFLHPFFVLIIPRLHFVENDSIIIDRDPIVRFRKIKAPSFPHENILVFENRGIKNTVQEEIHEHSEF